MNNSEQAFISAGIDIGTTTTQVIFSKIRIKDTSGFGFIPKISITDKKIIYRSRIHLTPLTHENEIDALAVKELILNEYAKAGIAPSDIESGAVIITGESAEKRNAKAVTAAISEIAGNFVVAAAGGKLESVLAGKGSGAMTLSKKTGKRVANLDIGGGTTNICLFNNGKVEEAICVDIGGRLIRIDSDKISYSSAKIKECIKNLGLNIKEGQNIYNNNIVSDLETIASSMTSYLTYCIDPEMSLPKEWKDSPNTRLSNRPDIITISGGVADCIEKITSDSFAYGDIGILLGRKIKESTLTNTSFYQKSDETVNATVIGAGNFSFEISGSTIDYRNSTFPLKNVQIIDIEIDNTASTIKRKIEQFCSEYQNSTFALAAEGIKCPTFKQIEETAKLISSVFNFPEYQNKPVIIIIKEDMAKAFGQALRRKLDNNRQVICIDGIDCGIGDYIDIAKPVASGQAVPVVVKTLIF
ncbi:MAG: ethanolamine ammonia-lyase reactivating factor EutA [Spirochaetales bacterium]|nr:ethanolamine ammonia-lyase reactivating factor EutA [Spirochaetales bacterium]